MNSLPHNNEVSPKPTRHYFYAKDKLRLLAELDSAPDQLGALLRREGIFSSDIDTWRKERDKGLLTSSSKKKGRPVTIDPKDKLIEQLERQNSRLKERAERAEAIVELQKKMAEILKTPLPSNDKPSSKK